MKAATTVNNVLQSTRKYTYLYLQKHSNVEQPGETCHCHGYHVKHQTTARMLTVMLHAKKQIYNRFLFLNYVHLDAPSACERSH